jgi:hypothetical protein
MPAREKRDHQGEIPEYGEFWYFSDTSQSYERIIKRFGGRILHKNEDFSIDLYINDLSYHVKREYNC